MTLKTADGQLKARLPAETVVRPGEQVGLAFAPERLSVFDKSSGRAVPSALHDGAVSARVSHG